MLNNTTRPTKRVSLETTFPLMIAFRQMLASVFVLTFLVGLPSLAQKPPNSNAPSPEPEAKSSPKSSVAAPSETSRANSTTLSTKPKVRTKAEERLLSDLRKSCERHYTGRIQGELRSACASAAEEYNDIGKNLALVRCRLNYGDEPRLVMACLVGATVAEDIRSTKEDYKKKLQLCAEHYPQHTEIDAFLQESCLTGVHLPALMTIGNQQRFQACAQISPERSFIGPCAVGLSLAQDMSKPDAPSQQNRICEQYFDHRRFHLTYRACLNARSVAVESTKVDEMIRNCANVMSNNDNDNERAACIIGTSIHRALSRGESVAQRFQKCGDTKVNYQERDVLACLTAASLLEFTDRSGAEMGCRDVFKNTKSGSRSNCLSSISQL